MMPPSTDEAIAALLTLAAPSFQIEQISPHAVRVQVFSAKTKRNALLTPLVLQLEVEIEVHLDGSRGTYGFSGRVFEGTGFSMSTQTFRGVYRERRFGKFVTLDGVVPVKFNTGDIFDQMDSVLQPLGWHRI